MSGDPAWLDGPAPPPLCGADGEETFTYVSIVQRLPAILDSTLSHWRPATDGGLDALAALRAELSDKKGDAVLTADLPAEDSEWNAWLAPLSDAGKTWLTAPWWVIENLFYRKMLAVSGWWRPVGEPGSRDDPFRAQKAKALSALGSTFTSSVLPLVGSTDLPPLLMRALWGNKADLSLSAGKVETVEVGSGGAGTAAGGEVGDELSSFVLCDDRSGIIAALSKSPGGDVAYIVDNCGPEIVSDFVLIDAMLRGDVANCDVGCIRLYVKAQPVFVSDVTAADIEPTFEFLAASGAGKLLERLRGFMESGRLVVIEHPFFNSPLSMWDVPEDLREALAATKLIIMKGDGVYSCSLRRHERPLTIISARQLIIADWSETAIGRTTQHFRSLPSRSRPTVPRL